MGHWGILLRRGRRWLSKSNYSNVNDYSELELSGPVKRFR